jgi:hypothetical protein
MIKVKLYSFQKMTPVEGVYLYISMRGMKGSEYIDNVNVCIQYTLYVNGIRVDTPAVAEYLKQFNESLTKIE